MAFKRSSGGNLPVVVLCILILLSVIFSAVNAYIWTTRYQDLKNALIAAQERQPKQGPIGLNGERGLQGYSGIPGPQGTPGAQGVQGVMGVQGLTGSAGPQGPKGDTGDAGPQGAQGNQGDIGPAGPATEFRCNPENNNYEYRYQGDDSWTIIEHNSNACKSSVL